MQKKSTFKRIALSALVAFSFSATSLIDTPTFDVSSAVAKEAKADVLVAKGVIKGITRKAKMITLDQKGMGFSFIKFNDETNFKNVADISGLKAGEKVKIEIKKVGDENIAVNIEKLLVKLPEGVTEIKTDELKAMIDDDKKDFVLIDTRPLAKYKENHIPGAVAVPYAKLKKVADNQEEGFKLLPFDKNALLVFYCGGDT